VTVSDETGWEFETIKRVYINLGLDEKGNETAVAWKIVRRSPSSTALRAEETRVEKLLFSVEPRDGKRFTVDARMLYQYSPSPGAGSAADRGAMKMAEAKLALQGRRPS
jgi:hypothetical protein